MFGLVYGILHKIDRNTVELNRAIVNDTAIDLYSGIPTNLGVAGIRNSAWRQGDEGDEVARQTIDFKGGVFDQLRCKGGATVGDVVFREIAFPTTCTVVLVAPGNIWKLVADILEISTNTSEWSRTRTLCAMAETNSVQDSVRTIKSAGRRRYRVGHDLGGIICRGHISPDNDGPAFIHDGTIDAACYLDCESDYMRAAR